MLTPETLDRLEAQASKCIGLEFSTPVAVNPGDLRELIACYRDYSRPAYIVDFDNNTITPAPPASADGNSKEQTA